MEDISVAIGIDMVRLSKYINESGLAQERYKGKPIPSDGSAPVATGIMIPKSKDK